MKVLAILSNPNKESFNHAIAKTVISNLKENGHEVIFHDLYEEKFPAIITYEEIPKISKVDDIISLHCSELLQADGIIIIHPNWWGQPPAILKGWVDRVIRPGVAYEFKEDDSGEGVPIGLLKAKVAIVFNTSNTYEEREMKVFGDPLETIWKNCIFDFCGVKNFYRKTYRVMVTSTLEEREEWLKDVKNIINSKIQ